MMPEQPVATPETRVCGYRYCRTEFKPKNRYQAFHTPTCRMREWDLCHPRKKTPANGKGWHYAKLEGSRKLQRVLRVMLDEGDIDTLDLAVEAQTTRPSSDLSELRAQGYDSEAVYIRTTEEGARVYVHSLTPEAKQKAIEFFAGRDHAAS